MILAGALTRRLRSARPWRVSATPNRCTMRSISSSVTMNGGASMARSPLTPSAWPTLGHTTRPASSAAAANVSANRAARGKRRPGRRVGHELDAGQESAAAHVAHAGQLAERREPRVKRRRDRGAALDQRVLAEIPQRGHAGGAERRMMRERLGMEQGARARAPARPPGAAEPPRPRAARTRRRCPSPAS